MLAHSITATFKPDWSHTMQIEEAIQTRRAVKAYDATLSSAVKKRTSCCNWHS